jgi:biopolymer transport protein ExbD
MSGSSHAIPPQLNATPLIDVLLVLLIMLIFAIPVATHNVTLDLPRPVPNFEERAQRIVVAIDFDGMITWNGREVDSLESLEARLRATQALSPAPEVRIEPDRRGRYERVAQVLAAAQRAHVRKLGVLHVPDH